MSVTNKLSDESLDLTVPGDDDKKSKKNSRSFSIESIISSCCISKDNDPREDEDGKSATDLAEDREPEEGCCEYELDKEEVLRVQEESKIIPRKCPKDFFLPVDLKPLDRKLMVPESDLSEFFSGKFPPGLEKFHRSNGLNGNLLEKINSVRGGDGFGYSWPFLYNSWLHNTGMLLNYNINGAIMGPQEFRGPGFVASPTSPTTENSDTSLSSSGARDLSRGSG